MIGKNLSRRLEQLESRRRGPDRWRGDQQTALQNLRAVDGRERKFHAPRLRINSPADEGGLARKTWERLAVFNLNSCSDVFSLGRMLKPQNQRVLVAAIPLHILVFRRGPVRLMDTLSNGQCS